MMAATGQRGAGLAWCVARGAIRMQRRGQRWRIVGECLSVCVRVYQHLSCLFLRCAGCCQGSFISAGWAPSWCSNRDPPCVSADPNPFIRLECLLSLSITFSFVKPSTILYRCRLNLQLTIKGLGFNILNITTRSLLSVVLLLLLCNFCQSVRPHRTPMSVPSAAQVNGAPFPSPHKLRCPCCCIK